MHVLIIFAHPSPHSFRAAVAQALRVGIETGATSELGDLHAERFDPCFNEADQAHYFGGPVPPEVARAHSRVDRADALALVAPVYWWSYPAILKGWIDRVFTPG